MGDKDYRIGNSHDITGPHDHGQCGSNQCPASCAVDNIVRMHVTEGQKPRRTAQGKVRHWHKDRAMAISGMWWDM